MADDSNYAMTDGAYLVSAKRFAQSPWLERYRTASMVLGVYSDRFYPLSLGEDPVRDYWRLRRGAVLFDVPEHPIEISGPNAGRLVQRLFCRDLSSLRIGRARYAIACNYEGGIVMDGVLMRLAQDRYWYVLASGEFMGWLDAHRAGLDVQVRDPDSWVLQIQGPRSFEVLPAVLDGPLPEPFNYFNVAECSIAGEPFLISRSGWTGEAGVELYSLNPAVDGARVFDHLMHEGGGAGLHFSSLESMGIRRIEAGIMDNGTDMDSNLTPFAAGLANFVDLDGPDFLGREALLKTNRGCCFFGVTASPDTPVGRHRVVQDGTEVGYLTATAKSPYLEQFIGYVRFHAPGEWLGQDVSLVAKDGSAHRAHVVALPFYDEQKKLPRMTAKEGEFDA